VRQCARRFPPTAWAVRRLGRKLFTHPPSAHPSTLRRLVASCRFCAREEVVSPRHQVSHGQQSTGHRLVRLQDRSNSIGQSRTQPSLVLCSCLSSEVAWAWDGVGCMWSGSRDIGEHLLSTADRLDMVWRWAWCVVCLLSLTTLARQYKQVTWLSVACALLVGWVHMGYGFGRYLHATCACL